MGLFDQLRAAPPARSFDRAELKEAGTTRTLTPDEFDALPMNVRVTAILGSRIRFFKGDTEIPPNKAVK